MSRNLILNTEFQNFINPGNFQEYSGILDFAWKWPFFCQFCRVGHQFSLIFVAKHEFCFKNWKMSFFYVFRCLLFQSPKITRYNKNRTFLNFWGKIHIQWQKLSWIDAQRVKIGKKIAISRWNPEFQKISGSFQEWWNFEILCSKLSFLA